MIKEYRDKINELKEKDKNTKRNFNKEIGLIIKQGIKDLQDRMDKNNPYKKFIEENKEMIATKYAFDVVVEDYYDAIELLKTLDIRELFNIDVKLNVPFKSQIFLNIEKTEGELFNTEEEVKEALKAIEANGKKIIDVNLKANKFKKWTYNVTYITDNKMVYINKINDKYKLFFKRNQGVDQGIEEESFDIINLYGMIMGFDVEKDDCNVVRQLCELFDIKIKYWIEQEEKYDFNISTISNKKYIQSNFPILSEYIDKYWYILEDIFEYGKKYIKFSKDSFNGESVFYYARNKIYENLDEKHKVNLTIDPKSPSELSKLINVFCILGLLRKLQKEEVPENLRRKPKKGDRFPNYFTVKKYTERDFSEAEKIVIKLNEKRVSATKMEGELCKEIFGKEIYNMVYLNNEKSTQKARKTTKKKKESKQVESVS